GTSCLGVGEPSHRVDDLLAVLISRDLETLLRTGFHHLFDGSLDALVNAHPLQFAHVNADLSSRPYSSAGGSEKERAGLRIARPWLISLIGRPTRPRSGCTWGCPGSRTERPSPPSPTPAWSAPEQ